MSAKMATPGLVKITTFWNGYDFIIPVNDVNNIVLSCDSNYNADVLMWPKFVREKLSERTYHDLNFIKIWPEKTLFLRGGLGSSSISWD